MKFIITFARAYTFKDEKTGKDISGVKINYLPVENLKPISDEDSKGVQFCSQSLSIDKLSKLTKVPALYECDTCITIKNGVPTISINDLKYLSDL